MHTRIFFLCALILAIVCTTVGCDKQHARKLAGTYACRVDYHYWDMMPTNIDSTYYEDVVVTQEGKNVIVLGTEIHIDSLWKEKEYYEGYIHNYIKVLFKKDSLYITRSGGGLGGNASWQYAGLKL